MNRQSERTYRLYAEWVLRLMKDYPDTLSQDEEWFALGYQHNVGPKLLAWMVENCLIERRNYNSNPIKDWYRAAPPDLGDLWIE